MEMPLQDSLPILMESHSIMTVLSLLPSWAVLVLSFSSFVTLFAVVASMQALLRWDTIHWPWSHVQCCGTRLPALWDPESVATRKFRDTDLSYREAALQKKVRAILGEELGVENETWPENAKKLRKLLTNCYLNLDSISNREGMMEFFASHRALARQNCLHCCLGIRFTVHYNLFCGTIMALGNDQQRTWLHGAQAEGLLGCFLLTEVGAGVLSGLIVETVATWVWSGSGGAGHFDLHTPTPTAEKTWISQGLAADWGIVVAQLIVEGENRGPHAFLIDMTSDGLSRESMGAKTTFNALDNARVRFNHVKLPKDSLLSKFCSVGIVRDGECWRADYKFVGDRPPSFIVIAQRLLSGRLCISDSAIAYLEGVFTATKKYAETRWVWIDKDRKLPLSALPYMEKALGLVEAGVNVYKAFLLHLQSKFAVAMEKNEEPSRELVTLIAAAKVEAVEFAIKSLGILRRDVGSYGLMASSPFGSSNDVLLCCRFAEGDSRVLQQMLTRDLVRTYSRSSALFKLVWNVVKAWFSGDLHTKSRKLRYLRDMQLLQLLWGLRQSVKEARARGSDKKQAETDAWLKAGDLVYNVAKTHAQHLIHSTVEHNFGHSADTDQFLGMSASDCNTCSAY